MTPADADLDLILDAAAEAGELAERLRRKGLEIEWKPGGSPVTNADIAADSLLKARLTAARPDYGWLSEETVDNPERLSRKRLFVVDPIDGTRAFIRDRPWWSVSIAVVEDDRPVAGVVVAPQVGETYTARAGAGAFLDGRPIHVSAACGLEGCGMVGDPDWFARPDWPEAWPAMRIERRNSTAYRMCLVASGAFDAALALAAKADWDVAAADLIAREAGAYVGDHRGGAFVYNSPRAAQPSLLCAAPDIAPLIMARVRHIPFAQ